MTTGKVKEHFGFLDGTSNPVLNKSDAGRRYSNQVHLGEILCGYPNMADKSGGHAEAPKLIRDPAARRQLPGGAQAAAGCRGARCGLVRRRRRKPRPRGHADARRLHGQDDGALARRTPERRSAAGRGGEVQSAFERFPFRRGQGRRNCARFTPTSGASIRETEIPNPAAGRRASMRRGMSYGPPRDRQEPDQERGLIFMAYNASLGEQYELVQRWLNGGNSSGSYSGQSDPIFGLAEPGRQRHFRFEHQGQTVRMALDGSDRLHDEPRPFVRVEWGAYLFAPSKKRAGDPQGAGRSEVRRAAGDMECGHR